MSDWLYRLTRPDWYLDRIILLDYIRARWHDDEVFKIVSTNVVVVRIILRINTIDKVGQKKTKKLESQSGKLRWLPAYNLPNKYRPCNLDSLFYFRQTELLRNKSSQVGNIFKVVTGNIFSHTFRSALDQQSLKLLKTLRQVYVTCDISSLYYRTIIPILP